MEAGVTPPPEGFELEQAVPPPPPGFEMVPTKGAKVASTPEDIEPGWMKKAYNFMGGASGLGGTAGSLAGTALVPAALAAAPGTMGLSALIPIIGAAAGGAGGAYLEGKDPLKEGAWEGGMQGLFHGLQRVGKPLAQFGRNALVRTFAGRDILSEAAEGLLKSWLNPAVTAKMLYDKAAATKAVIPLLETAKTVKDALGAELGRFPLDAQREIHRVLRPIRNFVGVGRGTGKQYVMSQNVADAMADVRRLGFEAKKAFKADNSDLGNIINNVRGSLIDDLEKAGVPEVREASKAYRREAVLEDLGRLVSKPGPVAKLADFKKTNRLYSGVFNKTEEAQIDRIVKKMTYVVPSGGAGLLGKAATTAMGAVIGAPLGSYGTAIGTAMGYAGSEYIHELFAHPWGRKFMEQTLESVYHLGPAKAANQLAPIWSAAARGLMGQSQPAEQ